MKRTLSLLLTVCMLLSCAVFFSGCSQKTDSDYPVTYGDVTIAKEPKNIVVLNDNLADIISYIGYDIKMVGRSVECDQDYFYVVPTVGQASAPDTAAITAAGADLVIADDTLSPAAKQSIEEAGVQVVTLSTPAASKDELLTLYTDLGTILGGNTTGRQKGEAGYKKLFNMLNTLNTATSGVVQTVAYLYTDESGQLCTFVKGTLAYQFFNYNGAANVFNNQAEPVVNTAELRIGSPNYLFYDSDAVLTALRSDASLMNIDALAQGHILMIPKKSFERQGATVEEAVYQMLNYIETVSRATADEAATEAPTVPATAAPTEAQTEAPTEAPATEAPAPEPDYSEEYYSYDDDDYGYYDSYEDYYEEY